MKNKRSEFILIKGGSTPPSESPTPSLEGQCTVLAAASMPAKTTADPGFNAFWPDSPPALRLSASPSADILLISPGVEGLRTSDSLRLTGHEGVLFVGVNELGWVVYDWIPGP